MRMPANPEDGRASARVVLDLWDAYTKRCGVATEPTFVGLAELTGVQAETFRVLVRRSQAGPLKTGPSFTTVARVAVNLGVDLDELGRIVTSERASS